MEHSMRLHANIHDFNDLIRLTATHFGILPEFIEKDYWITLILKNLSQSSEFHKDLSELLIHDQQEFD